MGKITNTVNDDVTIRAAFGSVNTADIIAAIENHSHQLTTNKVIWDFTNAYTQGLSSADLKEIADIAFKTNSHRPAGDKTAVIFSTELDMDIGRQVGKYLAINNLPYKFEVFTDMHDALIWLYSDEEPY